MTQHPATIEFHGHVLNVIDHAGRRWFTAEQIGLALGYDPANARKGILKLYDRHGDEFTEADTCVVNVTTQGQARATRLFSDTGCNKLGFFANTAIAKEFRNVAAKVLTGQATSQPAPTFGRRTAGPLVTNTRRLERQVFELFVAGMGQAAIARELRCSGTAVNQMLHAKYRFSPDAGLPEVTPELIAAVAARHFEIEKAKMLIARERLAQKFLTDAHDKELAEALNGVGQQLWQLALPAPEGGAQ